MKHGCGWEGVAPEFDASNARRSCPHVGAASKLFFFFFFFHGFALNQVDSARIEPYWPNRAVSAGDRKGPKWSKQAEIGLESCQNMSSHGGIGDDDDKVEFQELGSVYGTSSILMFLFQVLHWDTLCLCL